MVSSSSPDHRYPFGLWCKLRPQTLIQTPASAGQWTQTLLEAWDRTFPWPPHIYLFFRSPIPPLSIMYEPVDFTFTSAAPTCSPSFSLHYTYLHCSGTSGQCLRVFLLTMPGQCGQGLGVFLSPNALFLSFECLIAQLLVNSVN